MCGLPENPEQLLRDLLERLDLTITEYFDEREVEVMLPGRTPYWL